MFLIFFIEVDDEDIFAFRSFNGVDNDALAVTRRTGAVCIAELFNENSIPSLTKKTKFK